MSTQGPPVIHYEVYTFNGQRWNLHARYERSEREAAVADAKAVERNLQLAAKVVRETYYASNNISEEVLVYAGNQSLREKAAQRSSVTFRGVGGGGRGGGGGGGGDFAMPDFRARGARKHELASFNAMARLVLVILASMTLAGVCTGVANIFLDNLNLADWAVLVVQFSTFVVVFLAVAYPLAMKLVKWRPATAGGRGGRSATMARPVANVRREPKILAPLPEELEETEEELDWEGVENEDIALPPVEEPVEEPAPAVEPLPEVEQIVEDEAGAVDEAPPAVAEPVAPQPLSVEACRVTFTKFLKQLLAEVRKVRTSLDAYNLFGFDLLLAGGVEVLGNEHGLAADDRRDILRTSIESLGAKSESAKAFSDRYEDYLVEPRYLGMVQAGRNAMEAYLADTAVPDGDVVKVFQMWNKPQAAAAQATSRIQTVMFTDMVGSTDLTQARGDQGAQHVVRRHNAIVRSALAELAGKEIKHTGDGIMASFASAANGVEAAIVIQREIAEHNAKRADQPLHVRIGINAGEPIEEEDDIFGSTVQLAARVCAKCETDEILCTNVVRELSSGKGFAFEAQGAQTLKGFKEPIPLYLIQWRNKG